MKILFLTNIDIGLYRFRRELIETLVRDNEVYFCVPPGEYVDKIKNIGCKFIPCNVIDRRGTNPIKDLKLYNFYRRTITEVQPDVVLSYTIKPNVYGGLVCGRRRIPFISNVTGLGTTIENGGLLSVISTRLYKRGLKKASCVFFQNEENRKLFVDKGIVRGKTRLVPGSGVNLKTNSFEHYPNESNGIRFLFVGRIMKDKGIKELLDAMQIIHREHEDAIVDIVGFCDEDYNNALIEAEQAGFIRFHGLQSEMHSFYTNCHCAVLPSYHEGMANVLLEASATGRPVITTRVPGCQETFEEGVTGFGCEAKSAESLIEAMRKFINLPHEEKERMGLAARIKMEKEYDRSIVVEAYNEEIMSSFVDSNNN